MCPGSRSHNVTCDQAGFQHFRSPLSRAHHPGYSIVQRSAFWRNTWNYKKNGGRNKRLTSVSDAACEVDGGFVGNRVMIVLVMVTCRRPAELALYCTWFPTAPSVAWPSAIAFLRAREVVRTCTCTSTDRACRKRSRTQTVFDWVRVPLVLRRTSSGNETTQFTYSTCTDSDRDNKKNFGYLSKFAVRISEVLRCGITN